MCGIVGAAAERNIEKILVEGLKRLEYRGYDSAGIAVAGSMNERDNTGFQWQGTDADLGKSGFQIGFEFLF